MHQVKPFGISPAQRSYSVPSGSKFVPVVCVHFVLTVCRMFSFWGGYMSTLRNTPKYKTIGRCVGSHGSRLNCWPPSRGTVRSNCDGFIGLPFIAYADVRMEHSLPSARGPGSAVGIATSYRLDGPGIESRLGRNFPHLSRPALGPTQPPVQWVPGLSWR